MADQNTTTIPAGSPIVLNVAPASAPAETPEAKEAKREKRESRIAEAKAEGANEILKSLGVKKTERARMVEEIKSGRMKLAEAKAEAQAKEEEAKQAQAQVDAFKPYKDQVESLTSTLKEYAAAEFAALPEAFQKTIVEMKLDDPKAQLDMIKVFKKTGVLGAAATTKTEEKKPVAPSTTMATPNNAGVKDSPAGQTLNHYETWRAMTNRGENAAAAQYMQVHMAKILEQRPTK